MQSKVIVILLILSVKSCNAAIRKCCKMGFAIKSDASGCELVNSANLVQYQGHTAQHTASTPNAIDIPCKYPQFVRFQLTKDNNAIKLNDQNLTVNKSSFIQTYNTNHFCVDYMIFYNTTSGSNQNTVAIACPCLNGYCLNTCCKHGYFTDATSEPIKCVETQEEPWSSWTISNVSVPENEQQFVEVENDLSDVCPNEKIIVNEDHNEERLNFYLDRNGSLFVESTTPGQWTQPFTKKDQFCVTLIHFGEDNFDSYVLRCLVKQEVADNTMAIVYGSLLIIGAIFLLLTIIIHFTLPELRRAVRGLSIMAHCACMLIAYIVLAVIYFASHLLQNGLCQTSGYVAQYFLLAGFFWMNVLCIDIAITFRSLRGMVGQGSSKEFKKFLMYAIYAMAIPLFIFSITIAVNNHVHKDSIFHPQIGDNRCFFGKNTHGILLFFYGPIGLILLSNLIMFIYTAYNIIQIRRGAELRTSESHCHNRNQTREDTILYIKLFCLMGIPWIFEIISWAVGGRFWVVIDALNILRSIFIFQMFCCKREIWNMLIKKRLRTSTPLQVWFSKRGASSKFQDDSSTNNTARTNFVSDSFNENAVK